MTRKLFLFLFHKPIHGCPRDELTEPGTVFVEARLLIVHTHLQYNGKMNSINLKSSLLRGNHDAPLF